MQKKLLIRLINSVLAGTMLLALTACGSSASQQTPSSSASEAPSSSAGTEPTETPATSQNTEATEQETESGKGGVLVVYYSASGNTEAVANTIAEATGGALFELEPVEPYTNEDLTWTNEKSRVSVEHDNPDERAVKLVSTEVTDWDSYDTVLIGYPIWWGIAAWPVDSFMTANDFTGKTVIPFCTAVSSGLGESGELLAKMAGTGEWQEGQRFRSGVSDADVTAWIDELGLTK